MEGAGTIFARFLSFLAGEMLELISNFELELRNSSSKLSLAVLPASTSKFGRDLLHRSQAEMLRVGDGVPPGGVSMETDLAGERKAHLSKNV